VLLHQIVFQIIHAPSRVLNGVLIFVTQATGATGARFGAGVGVDTELQSQRMDVVSNHFHTARKSLRIDHDVAAAVAAHLPAIVNVDVLVTSVFHAGFHNGVGHVLNHVFADIASEFVPRIPAHGRCGSEIRRGRDFFLREQGGDRQRNANANGNSEVARFHADVLSEPASDWYQEIADSVYAGPLLHMSGIGLLRDLAEIKSSDIIESSLAVHGVRIEDAPQVPQHGRVLGMVRPWRVGRRQEAAFDPCVVEFLAQGKRSLLEGIRIEEFVYRVRRTLVADILVVGAVRSAGVVRNRAKKELNR